MPWKTTRKALAERRRELALRLANARTAFLVTSGDDLVAAYAPPSVNWYRPTPEDIHLPAPGSTLDDVLADLERGVADPDGLDGLDLAVWRDGRLLAVVRPGRDGRPRTTRFTDDDC